MLCPVYVYVYVYLYLSTDVQGRAQCKATLQLLEASRVELHAAYEESHCLSSVKRVLQLERDGRAGEGGGKCVVQQVQRDMVSAVTSEGAHTSA
jgi:hypothetical protein